MKLSRLKITNLRCVSEIEIRPKDYTSLIGPNNAGKSTVLRGIELFLGQITPSMDEWRQGHEREPIVIEGDFENIQEWERNKPGISSLVYENAIRLRMVITPPDEAQEKEKIETVFESFKPQEQIAGWPDDNLWSGLHADLKALAAEIAINGTNFKSKANQERVRTAIRGRFPDRVTVGPPRWTSEGVSIPAALQQAVPEVQLIPAVRDAEQDASPGAKTSFGLLLKSIIVPALTTSDEYNRIMSAVTDLETKLKAEDGDQIPEIKQLSDDISNRLSALITAKVTLGIDPPDAEKFIGNNTFLRIDDGTSTRIPLQGHGLQRALVFAMLEVLASQRAKRAIGDGVIETRAIVLLFEEPELFIHPHLMRRLREVLKDIASRPDWQVIISTHSPFLVDVSTDPRALVIHKRSRATEPPTVSQVSEDIFAGANRKEERERLRALLDFHPTVCEAFFAKRAVLVEGDTEVAVINSQPELHRLAGVDLNIVKDTTIVSCDGKWTIIPIARILKALGVPVRVIHDIDRKGKTDEQLSADGSNEFHANARIAEIVGRPSCFPVDDTFEDLLWDRNDRPSSSKDKPFRAWKRAKELCHSKENLNHVPTLRALVAFAFAPLQ